MWLGRSIVLCLLLSLVCAGNYSFPAGFLFGAGTSSFQIEGGWNASDKSESIWDRYTHEFAAVIRDGSNGDVACDSYHLWQKDIDIAAELGLNFYRFSVSWPRVLPTGFSNYVSEDGKNYYNNLIDGLLTKGIEPMVTIYHWDLPQRLQDLGERLVPFIVDWFAEYARVLYSLYADRVKIWNTINEPLVVCDMSYANYSIAPNFADIEVGRYLCNKHLVMAHARAWRIYDEEFRPKYNGMVSIVNHMLWFEPYAPGDEDLAELALQHCFGRYAHPIYSKEGGWPPSVEKIIAEKSKEEGYPSSRLPAFTKEEIELVRGTYDYMAINQYTARVVRGPRPGEIIGNFPFLGDVDMDIKFEGRAEWEPTGTAWFKQYPESLRHMLSWVKSQYGDMKVIITENGYASSTSDHEDYNRVNFYKNYLEQLLLAIHEDGVNVVGYSAWTLVDNFEWFDGYTTKFGLYEVDFKDPERPRTARLSAKYYASIIKARSLDVPYNYTVESPVLTASLEAAYQKFPPNFKFGAATSAYQIEGAWNASDKSPSIWDDLAHTYPHLIADGSNGDVVCDSYHQWERDIEVAHELGLHFYRFSISWTRLLPRGLSNEVSAVGKKYYADLIDGLLAKGIEPVVTLYHWDLPLRLQNLGGWANPLIANWFASYARVAYSLYADRVKTWITINEPLIVCDAGYSGTLAPLVIDPAVGVYLCTKHILLAHAKAWRIYDKEFRPKYHGQVSLTNEVPWFETDRRRDAPLAELAMEYSVGRFSHPIFSEEGGWPPVLESFMEERSKKEGYTRSRLPAFTREEIELIRGTYDFYGLNHYTSRVVRRPKPDEKLGMWPFRGSPELGIVLDTRPDWKPTHSWWFKQYPKGFRLLLSWLKEHYGDIPILVTENGYAGAPGLDDEDRVDFYRDYLTQLMFAIKKDGVNVTGYTAWSLMDNLEWRGGYTSRFGLYEVNFTDPMRTRTARSSASYYSSIIKNHSLGEPDDNKSYIVWITIGVILVTIALFAILYKYYSAVKTHRERMRYESVNLSAR